VTRTRAGTSSDFSHVYDIFQDRRCVRLPDRRNFLASEKIQKSGDVSGVRLNCFGGQPLFDDEMVDVPIRKLIQL
jgi:hypothetical protein